MTRRLISAAVLLLPGALRAENPTGFALRGELGGGTMLSSFQRESMGYSGVVNAAVRGAWGFANPFAVQVSYATWWAPAGEGNGQAHLGLAGLRVEPQLRQNLWLTFDANGGLASTGALNRPALEGGVGVELGLTRSVAFGPRVRYARIFANSQDFPSDAQLWSASIGVTWRPFRRPPPLPPVLPPDRDNDGVLDADDRCSDIPAGPTPDPGRPGCPRPDHDGDGVFDPDDRCVDIPAGEHADPNRPGCPFEDSDRDGVFDPDDVCPTVPSGSSPHPNRPGCPDSDTDADGVTDSRDQCPAVPRGAHPDPAHPGCPLPDRDSDAVPDASDRCPDRAGAPSTDPTRNGCPGLVRIEGAVIRILRPVFFATNRDSILPRSNPVLAAMADAMRADRTLRRVRIEGHTDDVANDDFNMALSNRRAERVREALIAGGVEAARLEAVGLGETRPVQPGRSSRARAQNRRVEFHVIEFVPITQSPATMEPGS
ncbi:MAG: OmpA family protein [Myxococcales bacterium]|nr:OmpA family protein [Myxococcales bacterium]